MVWVGRKSLGSSWFRTAFSYESCAKLPWLGGRHLFFVADKATLSTKGSKNSMVSLPEHRRWWNAWTACTSPLARQAFSKSISKSLRRSSRRVSICLHGFHGHFMGILWGFMDAMSSPRTAYMPWRQSASGLGSLGSFQNYDMTWGLIHKLTSK